MNDALPSSAGRRTIAALPATKAGTARLLVAIAPR